MVGLGRFELPTSRLSGVRSNQLSYRPVTDCSVRSSVRSCLPPYAAASIVIELGRAGSLKTEQESQEDDASLLLRLRSGSEAIPIDLG
jgi:hypothetical protein